MKNAPKIRLLPLQRHHVELIRQWRNENRQFFFDQTEVSADHQIIWWEKYVGKLAEETFVVCLRDENDRAVGTITTIDHQLLGGDGVEIARVMLGDKSVARLGVMEQAVSIVTNWYDDGMREVWLKVKTDNHAAIALYEKIWFRKVVEKSTPEYFYMEIKRQVVADNEPSAPRFVPVSTLPKLGRLYRPQPWCPFHTWLRQDPWGKPHHGYNGCFDGGADLTAVESLYGLVLELADRTVGPFHVAETGTADGFSSCFLARAIEDSDADGGHVWTVEYDNKRSTGEPRPWPKLWEEMGLGHLITGIVGDAHLEQTWGQMPAKIDFAFVDAEHSASAVHQEWSLLRHRLKPGTGVIAFHDVDLFPDVGMAVGDIAEEVKAPVKRLPSPRGLAYIEIPEGFGS